MVDASIGSGPGLWAKEERAGHQGDEWMLRLPGPRRAGCCACRADNRCQPGSYIRAGGLLARLEQLVGCASPIMTQPYHHNKENYVSQGTKGMSAQRKGRAD